MPDSTTDVEQIGELVVAIWRSVLPGVEVDADTNLLDVAATSLTAVRIRSRVRTEFGKEIELIDILENPTPRELALVIVTAPEWNPPPAWQQPG